MAKEMKRVLRENTTVDTQTGEVLKRETTVQFSKEPGFVKLYFDCLGVYIKNDGLSASLNDMLLSKSFTVQAMHKTGKSYTLAHTTRSKFAKRLTRVCAA